MFCGLRSTERFRDRQQPFEEGAKVYGAVGREVDRRPLG